MAFARVVSAQPGFPSAKLVSVECDFSEGLHSFTVVGLPDKAVEEARDRVNSAIKHSGFTPPRKHNRKVVISLAPADIKKEGPLFDVSIALAYLLASQDVFFNPDEKLFLGELALDGSIRSVYGGLSVAHAAQIAGVRELYVPEANAREAALITGIKIIPVRTLRELVAHLELTAGTKRKQNNPDTPGKPLAPQPRTRVSQTPSQGDLDFSDIRGQALGKRGLLLAAAGRHNIALFGPPGTGKTLLARAFSGILPPLTYEESLEATMIHSLASSLEGDLIVTPPFRSPHHSASHVSLVGGGTNIRPGEVTLAHRGVLFLDEFPEFEKRSLECLRQPLEDKVVTVSRARGSITYPANFILIAAMNPTPLGGGENRSLLSERERLKYQKKISGPLIDRIDMWIPVAPLAHQDLISKRSGERNQSDHLRAQVIKARTIQSNRFGKSSFYNSDMNVRDIDSLISLAESVQTLLTNAAKKLSLSPRSYHRVLKLARTIADVEGSEAIQDTHILEALQYRPKDIFG